MILLHERLNEIIDEMKQRKSGGMFNSYREGVERCRNLLDTCEMTQMGRPC